MVIEPRFGLYAPPPEGGASDGQQAAQSDDEPAGSGIWSVRLSNLRWLRERFREHRERVMPGSPERGLDKQFAESLGISPKYLGHLWAGRRNIGNAMARQIEQAVHFPVGWMDSDQTAVTPQSDDAREFMQQALDLFYQDPNGARRALLKAMHESVMRRVGEAAERSAKAAKPTD